MEKSKEELNQEEKRLLEKIKAIKESKAVKRFIRQMTAYAKNHEIPEFSFRIKEEQSALKKFREKGYEDADRVGDLIGMMFTTESTSQIYEVVKYLRETIPHDKEKDEDDFVKNPKAGYRSYHVNSKNVDFKDLQDIEAPLEVQVKTKPMQIAQNSVHDTVYKKGTLPKQIRDQLSEILFPVVEGMAQIAGFIDKDDTRESAEIKQEVNTLLKQNLSILMQYADVLNDVNKQYKLIANSKNDTPKQNILNELDLIQKIILEKNNSDKTNEMHDQKSSQFFEDIETGKYNVPPLLAKAIKDSEIQTTSKDMVNMSNTTKDKSQEQHRESQLENVGSER